MKPTSYILMALACVGALLAGCTPAYQYDPMPAIALDSGQSRSVVVEAQGGWRDTGIQISAGEDYRVNASGIWSAGELCGTADASGMAEERLLCQKSIFTQSFPVPQGKIMALVGRIGPNGKPFVIGGTAGFVADGDGMLFLRSNDPPGLSTDNTGRIEVSIQLYGEALSSQPLLPDSAPPSAQQTVSVSAQDIGVLAVLDQSTVFNVLDQVVFNPKSKQITLVGHTDLDYAGPPIPYLQHLAALLENPAPEFSLEWTADSQRRVDDFMRRMDNVSDWQKITSESMQLVDSSDQLTPQAKNILTILGVHPTRNDAAPGYLGVGVRLTSDENLEINSVTPGSPAADAGMRVGDVILSTSLGQFSHPFQISRDIRAAGAGTEIELMIFRQGVVKAMKIKIILGAADGDPWAGIGRKDIILTVLRKGGYVEAADTVQRVMDLSTLAYKDAPFLTHTIGIYWHGNRLEKYNETFTLRDQGIITHAQGKIRVMRLIPEILDDVMAIPGRPITATFDAKISQGLDYGDAYDMAIAEMERYLKQRFIDVWRKLITNPQEITIPLDASQSTMGFRPEVEPEFIRLNPGSAMARAMFEADYVLKTMIHNTDLAKRIPGYKTIYAFERNRPGGGSATATERIWLSIASLDMAQSASGNTLRTKKASMRFNIEGIGGRTVSAPYAKHLTSHYDGIARAVPVFHELREAAKLSGAAMWLRQKTPGLRLPKGGAVWQPPRVVPGAIYQTWSPRAGENRIVMMAMGGISMVPPVGPAGPVWPPPQPLKVLGDPSVVDLSGSSLTAMPSTYDNKVLAKILRRKVDVPVPRPLGWVASIEKGISDLRALSIRTDDVRQCKAIETIKLGTSLEQAREIAEQLDAVDEAIGLITEQHPDRQAAFAMWEQKLNRSRDRFIANAFDTATYGVFNTHQAVRTRWMIRRMQSPYNIIRDNLKLQAELKPFEDRLRIIAVLSAKLFPDDYDGQKKVVSELVGISRDIGEASVDVMGSGAAGQVLRGIFKASGYARYALSAVGFGENLLTLINASKHIEALTAQTEAENQALLKTLQPMRNRLSDQLDQASSTTAINDWMDGKSRCR